MLNRIFMLLICFAALVLFVAPSNASASALGDHFKNLEAQKKKKSKELGRLEDLAKVVENEIATTKAQMAQSAMNTAPKIGYQKTNAQGMVTTTNGVVHAPSKHWKMDFDALRKSYEKAGIYTPDEIENIITFHEAYIQNQGFTAECTEYLAKMAESNAQLRTLKKYIDRKKQEIKEIDNALTGTSASADSEGNGSGNASSSGGGGGGGGY